MWYKAVWMIMAVLSLIVPGAGSTPRQLANPIRVPSVVRFRVIANSDNPIDQAVKLDVRDVVLNVLEPGLIRVHNERQALSVIASDRHRLITAADGVLQHFGVGYRAQVLLTRTAFPTKVYGTLVLPAGRYVALLVKLGKAQGHNWWCVLYPSLCFIDMTNGVAVPQRTAQAIAHRRPAVSRGGRMRVSWALPKAVVALIRMVVALV